MVGSHASIPKAFVFSRSASPCLSPTVNCLMLALTAGMRGAKLIRRSYESFWKRVATNAPLRSWRERLAARHQSQNDDAVRQIYRADKRFNRWAFQRQPTFYAANSHLPKNYNVVKIRQWVL